MGKTRGVHMKKLIFLVIPLLLCGCTSDLNRREIDELNIVHVLGVDYADGEYTITVVYNSGGGGGQENSGELQTASGSGKTAYQAFEDLKNKNRKSISIAHTGFYLIGDEAARRGIDYCIDFISRDETIKLEAMVFVAKDRKASDFIEQGVENKKLLQEELQAINQKQMESMKRNGNTIVTILNEMDNHLASLLIPYIIYNEEIFLIDGYAVFDQLRLRDYLDSETSSGVNFVKNIVRRYPIFLEDEGISLVMSNTKTNVETFLEQGNVMASIRVDFETQINEVYTREDIFSQTKLSELTEKQNSYLQGIIKKAVDYAQATHLDILQLSRMIENQHPRQWKMSLEEDWPELLGEIEFEYDINSRISKSFIIENER